MDKKFILICVITLALSVGTVSAVKMETKTFDDAFSIKVPNNSNFDVLSSDGENGFNFSSNVSFKMYMDEKNQIILLYSDVPFITTDSADWWYQNMFQNMNPNLDSCYETQIKASQTNAALAGNNKGNNTVLVAGPNYDLVKSMGQTVKFK